MKVAILTTTFNHITNGPTKFIRLIHENCNEQEHSNEIIIFTEDTNKSRDSVQKIFIPDYLKLPGIGFLYRLLKYFYEINRQKEISTVVLNNTMYGFLFYLFSNKRIIGFINDPEHFTEKKGLSYTRLRSILFSKLEMFSLQNNHVTLVNSVFLKKIIEKHFKIPPPIRILYKGVELNEKLNLKKHDNDEIFRILFVKSNYNIGGLKTLLESLENHKNYILNVVTSKDIVDDKYFDKYRQNTSMKLHHNLIQKEVFDLMKISHCLCIPSNIEALGVANMEGMVHSCAIISTNVGGIPEVLDYGRVGIMIDAKDSSALTEKIKILHENRILRKEYVLNAHNYVKKFSIENSILNFHMILDE